MIINTFTGPNAFLSNFSPASVVLDDMEYPTVENAYQAAKTLDEERRELFLYCSPGYAKKQGRQLSLRKDWSKVRNEIMLYLLRQKFQVGTTFAADLLGTGDAYICEGNSWHDNYWGACRCDMCAYSEKQNWLGRMLMQIREELQKKDGAEAIYK